MSPVLLSVLSLVAAPVGCASLREPPFLAAPPDIVWPAPPDAPRVRFLGELKSSDDVGRRGGFTHGLNALLYGRPAPDRLVTPHAVAVDAAGVRIAVADTNGGCVHLFDLERRVYTRLDDYDAAAPAAGGGDTTVEGRRASSHAHETLPSVDATTETPRGPMPAARWSGSEEESSVGASLPPRCPVGVAWGGDTLAIADANQARVYLVDRSGGDAAGASPPRSFGESVLQRPSGIAFNPTCNRWYVVDAAAHAVFVFERDGRPALSFGRRGPATGEFNYPAQIAVAADGSVAVTDALNFRVQRFTADGAVLGAFGRKGDAAGDFALPKGVAIDGDGNLWVSDAHFENVQAFTPDGQLLMSLGREGAALGQFWLPAGMCIDRQDRLWIADTYNRRVQVFQLVAGRESGSQGVRERRSEGVRE
ncbi:MAG: hypothetical protein C4547_00080 [Phycisphaerales bacterium]|nr:MAG: hypothetical protein C4547_00080 [Phycisphaerales bacterium]